MNKKKAVEYFRLINGRNPTERELNKLLSQDLSEKKQVNVNLYKENKINGIVAVTEFIMLALMAISVVFMFEVLFGRIGKHQILVSLVNINVGITSVMSVSMIIGNVRGLVISHRLHQHISGNILGILANIAIVGLDCIFLILVLENGGNLRDITLTQVPEIWIFIFPFMYVGAWLTFFRQSIGFKINNVLTKRCRDILLICSIIFLLANAFYLVSAFSYSTKLYFSGRIFNRVFLTDFTMLLVVAVFMRIVKFNRIHPFWYVMANLLLISLLIAGTTCTVDTKNAYQDAAEKISEINKEIKEDKRYESLSFDGEYNQVVNTDSKENKEASRFENKINKRQNSFGNGGVINLYSLDDGSMYFFENNFNGTLSKSGLKAINNRVSNLSSFVFEVNLFSKKLDKFGTTGDEQPLSNFFDLNTALKIINSKNYTGQITTNELETDGFLN